MPSSAEMQARDWEIQSFETDAAGQSTCSVMDRFDIMLRTYRWATRNFSLSNFPRHWQDWGNLCAAITDLAEAAMSITMAARKAAAGANSD